MYKVAPIAGHIHKELIPGVNITIDDYRTLIQDKVRERMQVQLMQKERPMLYMCLNDLKDRQNDAQPILYMSDLQIFLAHALYINRKDMIPRWCRIRNRKLSNHVVVVVLDSMTDADFTKYNRCFPTIKSSFRTSVEMVCSEQYGVSLFDDVFMVPKSKSEKRNLAKLLNKQDDDEKKKEAELRTLARMKLKLIHGSLAEEMKSTQGVRSMKPCDKETSRTHRVSHWKHDKYPRTSLLMRNEEMMMDRYPLPASGITCEDFVFTRDNYITPNEKSPLFGIDCEMCLTSRGDSQEPELTRISIVDENMDVVYDTFVKPFSPITDYLTAFSGITKKLLDPVTTRLTDVQKHIRSILPDDAILVGHSFSYDLKAMHMFHPYVIDTSVTYQTKRDVCKKTSLKDLSNLFLQRIIQDKSTTVGHSSIEDAKASLELVLLKLQHDEMFGDCERGGIMVPSIEVYDDWYLDMINQSTVSGDGDQPDAIKDTESERLVKDKTVMNGSERNDNDTGKRKCDKNSPTNKKSKLDDKISKDTNGINPDISDTKKNDNDIIVENGRTIVSIDYKDECKNPTSKKSKLDDTCDHKKTNGANGIDTDIMGTKKNNDIIVENGQTIALIDYKGESKNSRDLKNPVKKNGTIDERKTKHDKKSLIKYKLKSDSSNSKLADFLALSSVATNDEFKSVNNDKTKVPNLTNDELKSVKNDKTKVPNSANDELKSVNNDKTKVPNSITLSQSETNAACPVTEHFCPIESYSNKSSHYKQSRPYNIWEGEDFTRLQSNAEQRSHFFKKNDHSHYNNLLKYTHDRGLSARLINETGITAEKCFSLSPRSDVTETRSDQEAVKDGMKGAQANNFTWVRLRGYDKLKAGGEVNGKDVEACLRKIDQQACKIIDSAPLHSSCVIIMPGQGELNARVFIKIQAAGNPTDAARTESQIPKPDVKIW